MVMHRYVGRLLRDLFVVAGSILAAVIIVKLGFLEYFANVTGPWLVASSFVAGAFFASIFTMAPASIALIGISQSFPPVLTALFSAAGATLVDVVIVSFLRKEVTYNLDNLDKITWKHHIVHIFHFGFLKWVALIVGTLSLVAPLPDEIGLFLLGISRVNPKILPLIFFVTHFLGVWLIISIAGAL